MNTILETALTALEAGFSIIPVMADGSKKPALPSWKEYQSQRPSPQRVREWFGRHPAWGLAVVGGQISGNLEVMDFDNQEFYQRYKATALETGLAELVTRVEAGYCEHSPKGVHWLYRHTAESQGSQKLASRSKPTPTSEGVLPKGKAEIEVMVETRGEASYCIVAPSGGGVHPSGKPYNLISGDFGQVVTLTPQERENLLTLALALDETTRPEPVIQTRAGLNLRPGDDFNQRASWEEVLEPHGWSRIGYQDSRGLWRRPGKNEGISATTGYGGTDFLYIFSTSTVFEARKGYTKFSAYAQLEHNGDLAAAARSLAAKGYGSKAGASSASGEVEAGEKSKNGSKLPATPSKSAPQIISAPELLSKHFEPIRWIVPDLLPEGATMLAARPKMGKSWLALNWAIAVATGGQASGKLKCEKGQVLYLALEDNQRRLKDRLSRLLPEEEEAPACLHFATEWGRVGDSCLNDLKQWLEERPEARLVILDTLAKVRPLRGGAESIYEADYNALQGFKQLADFYHVAILIIHHNRKGNAEDALEEISGSFGLTASIDNAYTLRRNRGEAEAVLNIMGRDIEDQELALKWHSDLCLWELVGEAKAYAVSKERKEIMQILKANPKGLRAREVAELTRKQFDTTRQTLLRMYQSGQIEQPERGVYVLGHNLFNQVEA